MKKFVELDYIQKFDPTISAGKTDLSPEKDTHFQTIIPQLTALSRKIKSSKKGLFKCWLARFWKGPGFTVLFLGATGRSRTLALNFLDEYLNYPIILVDLSKVVGKYIGEKEKNLNQLFNQAE